MKNIITTESLPTIKPDITEPVVPVKPDVDSIPGIKPGSSAPLIPIKP